jgi:uncharacterized membrane protein
MDPEVLDEQPERARPLIPAIASVIAIVGLADSIYLTVHHFTAEPVPCSLIDGCETVLTSQWAEIAGIPLAAFGAAAYFVAFSLALLTAFGDRRMWKLFGAQSATMAAVSLYLVYVQGALIGAFCQFCLLSAFSSILLFVLFLITVFARPAKTHGPV